jgi:glycerophosphoryl diester phosphodiesterase
MKIRKDKFTPIAHRGGNEVAPENTLESFKDAYQLGYRWLETDVRLSKDGVLYAFHDEHLNRIIGKNEKLSNVNSWDIDQLDIKERYRVPRLETLLNIFPDVTFNLDAKSFSAAEVLVDIINSKKVTSKLCLGSFHDATIKYIRKNIRGSFESAFSRKEVLQLLFTKMSGNTRSFDGGYLQIPCSLFGLNLITKNLVEYCKEQKIKLHVWTINDEKTMSALINLGVDGIMTDKCRSLLKIITYE